MRLVVDLVEILVIGLVLLAAVKAVRVGLGVGVLDLAMRIIMSGVLIMNRPVQLIQVLVVGLVLLLAAKAAGVRRVVGVLDLPVSFVVGSLVASVVQLLLQRRAGGRVVRLRQGGRCGQAGEERRRRKKCRLHGRLSVGALMPVSRTVRPVG